MVREDDALLSRAELLDIPLEAAFRQHLRIYDLSTNRQQAANSVHVRLYAYRPKTWDVDPPSGPVPLDRLVYEETISLPVDAAAADVQHDIGFAERSYLSMLGQFAPGERLRVTIEPVATGMRFWAFVTITNNETQQVSVVTPQ